MVQHGIDPVLMVVQSVCMCVHVCSSAPCQEAGGWDDEWETGERALGRNSSLICR